MQYGFGDVYPDRASQDVLEYASQSIAFLDPEGRNGDIGIRQGMFAPSQWNIQIFLP